MAARQTRRRGGIAIAAGSPAPERPTRALERSRRWPQPTATLQLPMTDGCVAGEEFALAPGADHRGDRPRGGTAVLARRGAKRGGPRPEGRPSRGRRGRGRFAVGPIPRRPSAEVGSPIAALDRGADPLQLRTNRSHSDARAQVGRDQRHRGNAERPEVRASCADPKHPPPPLTSPPASHARRGARAGLLASARATQITSARGARTEGALSANIRGANACSQPLPRITRASMMVGDLLIATLGRRLGDAKGRHGSNEAVTTTTDDTLRRPARLKGSRLVPNAERGGRRGRGGLLRDRATQRKGRPDRERTSDAVALNVTLPRGKGSQRGPRRVTRATFDSPSARVAPAARAWEGPPRRRS